MDQVQRKRLDQELDQWAVSRLLHSMDQVRAGDYAVERGIQEKLSLADIQRLAGFPAGLNDVLMVAMAITARHGRIVPLPSQDFDMYIHFGSSFFDDAALCLQLVGRRLTRRKPE